MKGVRYILSLFAMLLFVASCQDLYYMPFKESDKGMGTAAFYLDGNPYRTSSSYKASGNGSETSCGISFKCISETHGLGSYSVSINIQTPENSPIQCDYEYKISAEQDIPYVSIAINGYQVVDGYVKFRKYESVISGNFELSYVDDNGARHSVKYGTFDVLNL